jgi:hypothetical protein
MEYVKYSFCSLLQWVIFEGEFFIIKLSVPDIPAKTYCVFFTAALRAASDMSDFHLSFMREIICKQTECSSCFTMQSTMPVQWFFILRQLRIQPFKAQ